MVDQQRFTLGSSTIVQETVYCPTLAACVACFQLATDFRES
ncbi:hypothetical protein [Anabaenopsis elenkinii]|nr:hypothetical protein [Anabaenopsis elenkinii]